MNQQEHVAELLGDATIEVKVSALFRALALPAIEDPYFREVERTFTEASVPRIGSRWNGEGGIYAGVIRGKDRDYHLIFGGASKEDMQWGGRGKEISGASSEYDGRSNTLAIIESGAANEHPAAQWARSFEADGHSDFYLPARRESALLYANLPELFEKKWHWSSTQSSALYAWGQVFDGGNQHAYYKGGGNRSVAVRRLFI